MGDWRALKSLWRRAIARIGGAFFYMEVLSGLGYPAVRNAVWNDGHLLAFILLGFAASALIDVFQLVTKPAIPDESDSCDENDSELD